MKLREHFLEEFLRHLFRKSGLLFSGHRFVFAQVNAVRVIWFHDRLVFFMLKLVRPLRHSPQDENDVVSCCHVHDRST